MEWQPEVQVKVVEKEVIKEVIVEAEPKIVEVLKTPPPPEPEPPKEVLTFFFWRSLTLNKLLFTCKKICKVRMYFSSQSSPRMSVIFVKGHLC
jgi:hypothetical protein